MTEKIKAKIVKLYERKLNNEINEEPINEKTIEFMKFVAEQRGGKCLSDTYTNMTTHLEWQCSEGHTWNAMPTCVISRGQWCPRCSKKNSGVKKIDWQELIDIAKNRNGKLLSTEDEYENTASKLKWQCQYGHSWRASIASVRHAKRWCPTCNTSYGENVSRMILEKIFNKPFNTTKPEWLINPKTLRRLELDGYNEELSIAFEYNGIQHYEPSVFSIDDESFKEQQHRDEIKKQICDKRNILLILIPHICNTENSIKKHIIKQLKKNGHKIKDMNITIDGKKIFNNKRVEKFEKKVKDLGYELLSPYKGILGVTTLKCPKGHIFDIAARSVDRNNGCPVCSGYRKKSTEEIKKLCEDNEVVFVEEKYVAGKRFMTKCIHCGKQIRLRMSDIRETNKYKCKCKMVEENGNKKHEQ